MPLDHFSGFLTLLEAISVVAAAFCAIYRIFVGRTTIRTILKDIWSEQISADRVGA